MRFWRPSLCQLSYQSKKPPLESNQPCLHTRAALQTALRRQMARYCGIEPHPISRFGGVSICTYRIDAQSAKREERKMPAKPKGGKLSWGFVSETACIGLPFRHCRWYYSITFARFLYIPRTYPKLYKKSRVFYALSSKSQKGVASQISARASNPTVMALDAVCACAKPTSAAACSRVLPST